MFCDVIRILPRGPRVFAMERTHFYLTNYEIYDIICINRSGSSSTSVNQIYCRTIHSLLDSINNARVSSCIGENK